MYTSAVTTHTATAPGVRGSRFCPTCNTLKMIDSTNTMMKNYCCHTITPPPSRESEHRMPQSE